MPKVSVIIPVYKVEPYIERCARSLFEQTLDDIEYLFVDDCTPDKSVDILIQVLEDYPQRKKQVIIHRMKQNSGLSAVRKWGIMNATGEFVIHCDSDDWVDTDMYRAMYEKAKENNADVVVSDFVLTDGRKILERTKGCSVKDIQTFKYRLLFQKDPWSIWNKLFRRTVYSKDLSFPMENMGEDMVICLQIIMECQRMGYVAEPYYHYFVNNDSITNRRNVSTHVRNYESLKANTDLIIEILNNKDIKHKKWVINGLQYNATRTLLNVIHRNSYYRNLWLQTYPNAIWYYLINPYIKIEKRFKCFLVLLGIYPFKKDRI